jgi:protein-disulfide isomerase
MEKYAIAYRGNKNSKVTMYIISDFDCGKCIEHHSTYNSIYNKYKDRVKFGYVNYSGNPSPLIIASESFNNQGKFWEFHDTAFNIDVMIDSTRIFRIADSLQVNMMQFTNDFNSTEIRDKISQNFIGIENAGIYATPTIIINNRLLFNSASYDEIAKLIDTELSKQ